MKRGSEEISDDESEGTQVKRGRGRPKIPDNLKRTKPKIPSGKPRGRPKKHPGAPPKVSSGRGRGRPKKDPNAPPTPKKDKAEKQDTVVVQPVKESSSSRGRQRISVTKFTPTHTPSKPGRGRPKKSQAKGRGRPRKSEGGKAAKATPTKSPNGRKRGRPAGSIKLVVKVNSKENGEDKEEDDDGEEST